MYNRRHSALICLALAMLYAIPAVAQNGYSFLDAETSAVSYTRAYKSPARSCEEFLSRTGYDYSVLSARLVPASGKIPEHCRVAGVIPPVIRFQVNMPAAWNGRFYMYGNGGFAGTSPDSEGRARTRESALLNGFATAYTDTGHDRRFEPLATFAYNNLQMEIDYSFRAVHLTVVTAKELIGIYYGDRPSTSYWDGCSTGGRQGLMSAQRFPADFDGIVVGAPVLDFTGTMVSYVWNNRALQSAPISSSKLTLVAKAVYARCDELDGLEDGLIEDPRRCDFRPTEHLAKCNGGTELEQCFTEDELQTLTRIYGGVTRKGELFFPGQPLGAEAAIETPDGSETGWDGYLLSTERPSSQFRYMDTFLKYMAFPEDDPDYDWTSFDIEEDPDRMAGISEILDATNPDLTRFEERGGKILSYFGWADALLNPIRATDYYEQVESVMGDRVGDFYRLFMVPGMFHCDGGYGVDRFDALTPLVEWVENGTAPEKIIASRVEDGARTMTRPLCPYPQVARYKGVGSPNEAGSFFCTDPE